MTANKLCLLLEPIALATAILEYRYIHCVLTRFGYESATIATPPAATLIDGTVDSLLGNRVLSPIAAS